jgi:hypothetical protein
MKRLDCSAVEELLDLYAANECDARTGQTIRAHLGDCGACRQKLEESRQLVGLLDLHYRTEAALARLQRSLEGQTRARPGVLRLWPGVQRIASVAALLLVTVGLWLGLGPIAHPPGKAGIEASLGLSGELAVAVSSHELAVAPMREGAFKKKSSDPPGSKASASTVRIPLRRKLPDNEGFLIPQVPVDVVLHNSGSRRLHVEVGCRPGVAERDCLFRCRIDLQGPKVEGVPAFPLGRGPFDGRELTIEPGGSASIHLDYLASFHAGSTSIVYPAEPGDYVLTVRLRLLAWEEGAHDRRRLIEVAAGPIHLRVEELR